MRYLHTSSFSPSAPSGRDMAFAGRIEVVLGNPRHECRFQGICRIDILPFRSTPVRAGCPHGHPPLRGHLRLWPTQRRCLLLLPHKGLSGGAEGGNISIWSGTSLNGAMPNGIPSGYLLPGRYHIGRADHYDYLLLHWRPDRSAALKTTKNYPL